MNKEIKRYPDIEEEYLDHLIKLTFDLDDLEKEQEIEEDIEKGSAIPDELTVQRTWQSAQQKIGDFQKKEKHQKHVARFRHAFPKALQFAACIMLVILISIPAVLASSAEIRSKVIQMLINIDRKNEVVNFNFVENPDTAFTVPAEWDGDYFLSAIPEGMEITWYSSEPPTIEYKDKSESASSHRGFSFGELKEVSSSVAGLEGCTIEYVDINSAMACVIEGEGYNNQYHSVDITWANEERMFTLTCHDMTKEEALGLARSIRKIIQ